MSANERNRTQSRPLCGEDCQRDEADNGIAIIYGPFGCECGWSEWERYNHDGKKAPVVNGYRTNSLGIITPLTPHLL